MCMCCAVESAQQTLARVRGKQTGARPPRSSPCAGTAPCEQMYKARASTCRRTCVISSEGSSVCVARAAAAAAPAGPACRCSSSRQGLFNLGVPSAFGAAESPAPAGLRGRLRSAVPPGCRAPPPSPPEASDRDGDAVSAPVAVIQTSTGSANVTDLRALSGRVAILRTTGTVASDHRHGSSTVRMRSARGNAHS